MDERCPPGNRWPDLGTGKNSTAEARAPLVRARASSPDASVRTQASLESDGGAGALEGGDSLVRSFLVDTLQDDARSGVDQVLGLLETEGRERAHLLDDLDLLLADGLEDDVEGVLLLDLLDLTGGGSGHSDGCRRGGGDIEGHLELLHEVGELDEGEALELVEQLVDTELRHDGVSFLVVLLEAEG